MQPENIIQNDSPHPNYKRVLVLVAVLFVIIIIATATYYFFSNNKKEKALVARYNQEQVKQLELAQPDFFKNSPKPWTDNDKKVIQAFFTNTNKPESLGSELETSFNLQQQQAEVAFQEWKKLQK